MPPERDAGMPRVFFYVQHLLGIGHLHRAARIARALAGDGFRVRLALGGEPTPLLDIGAAEVLQLPPVKAGPEGFGTLVHADDRVFDEADAAERTRLLIASFQHFAPDILLVEAFPFGRRQMRFELLPLLERARTSRRSPLIAASVRDILQRNKRPERVAETVELVARWFDLVLVHGDPAMSRIEASFPDAHAFADKVRYTGIVAPDIPVSRERRWTGADPRVSDWRSPRGPGSPKAFGAVVSAGGGAVGGGLIEAALKARPATRIADRPWLVLTGPNLPDDAVASLASRAAGQVRFERFLPDLAGVLAEAELSIGQAGYNTVADILVAECRAVLIPFANNGETEQTDRAALLEERGLAVVVPERTLTPATLAAAVDRALDRPLPGATLDLDGARTTGRILRDAMGGRSRLPRASALG